MRAWGIVPIIIVRRLKAYFIAFIRKIAVRKRVPRDKNKLK